VVLNVQESVRPLLGESSHHNLVLMLLLTDSAYPFPHKAAGLFGHASARTDSLAWWYNADCFHGGIKGFSAAEWVLYCVLRDFPPRMRSSRPLLAAERVGERRSHGGRSPMAESVKASSSCPLGKLIWALLDEEPPGAPCKSSSGSY
jgi:hypothetical protein